MKAKLNPFTPDVCAWPKGAIPRAPSVHGTAWARIEAAAREASSAEISTTDPGSLLLLSAPRAGFGKSHLLAKLASNAPESWLAVPLVFDLEHSVSWPEALHQVLCFFHETLSSGSKRSAIDELVARLVAKLNERLIEKGLVRCENDMVTLRGLRANVIDIYDLSNQDRPVAQWFVRNFDALLPACSEILASWNGLTEEAASEWLRALCDYAKARNKPSRERWQSLLWGIGQIGQLSDGGVNGLGAIPMTTEGEHRASRQRVTEFLKIVSNIRLPILVVDDVTTFFGDTAKGLRLAGLLTQLAESVPRSLTVLAVNGDLWRATFSELPSAFEDRLTAKVVTLRGLSPDAAEALIRFRLVEAKVAGGDVEKWLTSIDCHEFITRQAGPVSPRMLLRQASRIWEQSEREPAGRELAELPSDEIPSLFPEGEPQAAPAARLKAPSPAAPGVLAPSGYASRSDDPVITAFQERLDATVVPGEVDPSDIANLLRIAGQHFAVVRYREVEISSNNGASPVLAGTWETQGMRLIFGVKSYDDQPYWNVLRRHAKNEANAPGFQKLALFAASGQAWPFDSAECTMIDPIELSPDAARRVVVASHLLKDSESGAFPAPVAETLAALVDPLDFFWKRVTRARTT